MASEEILHKTLRNADGKPFAKYKGITNNFTTEAFELLVDEVQNDRAGHSRMRVRVPMKAAAFPEDTYSSESRRTALRDIIARRFWECARTYARSPIPKTDGGEVYIPRPGQEIIERGSVAVTEHYVEVSFTADLPSSGGKVNAMATEELIFGRIGRIVAESMMFRAYKQSKLYNHIQTAENADHIRASLRDMGFASFIAVGSILPRRDDDLAPLTDAVPFDCDDSLKVTIEVPNGEPVTGMGLPRGFTVITGRSRCGKSVLAEGLVEQTVADVKEGGAVVGSGSVDAVRSKVHVVAVSRSCGVVLQELHHGVALVALPDALAVAQRLVPPHAVLPFADGVSHLVHDSSGPLIADVCSHIHPAAITAIGRWRTGAVIDGDMQSADAGQVVPICQCFLCAVVDSCVGSLVCAVAVVRVADRSFGDGDDFDDVAISHGMPFGHGVCTDIING